MNLSNSTRPFRRAASALALAALGSGFAATGAWASPVTVQASFTAYRGCIAEPGVSAIVQWINGVQVVGNPQTDAPCPTGSSNLGYVTVPLAPHTSSVSFYNNSLLGLPGYDNTANLFSYTPTTRDVTAGQRFVWGNLTIANGVWVSDFELDITFRSSSLDPNLDGHVWTDTLVYHLTPNPATGTPHDNGDFVSIVGHPELGSLQIDELWPNQPGSNQLTVGLQGHIGSLHLDAFVDPVGFGSIVPAAGGVPEPTTAALLGVALLSAGAARRRPQRR